MQVQACSRRSAGPCHYLSTSAAGTANHHSIRCWPSPSGGRLARSTRSTSQSVQALSRPWEAGVVAVDDTEMRTCQGDGHGESAHVLGDHYTPFGDSCFEDGSVIDTPQLGPIGS